MDKRDGAAASARHVPVLADRVLALLAPAIAGREDGAVVVDAAVGLGGHAAALLNAHPQVRVIGLDRDPQALAACEARLAAFGPRVRLVRAVYDALPEVLADANVEHVAGVLFDLGVSSLQLDADDRGFSYARDTALDMRMDPSRGQTAADVVNTYPVDQPARFLSEFGEELFARRIAAAIVRARTAAPLTSSRQL